MPMLNRYTITAADEAVGMPGANELTDLAKSFDADMVYNQIMEHVTASEYVGPERVDGVDCQQCRYESDSDGYSVDIWFEDGDHPLERKIVPDLTKALARQAGKGAAGNDTQIQWAVTFIDV